MEKNIFKWESKVRDYELDSLNMVNNATFVNYLEQARNDFARSAGIDFIAYHQQGYSLVVAGIEIKYRRSLRANDEFYVTVELTSIAHKRIFFDQKIFLKKQDALAGTAKVTVACVDHKTSQACMPDWLKNKLGLHISTAA